MKRCSDTPVAEQVSPICGQCVCVLHVVVSVLFLIYLPPIDQVYHITQDLFADQLTSWAAQIQMPHQLLFSSENYECERRLFPFST